MVCQIEISKVMKMMMKLRGRCVASTGRRYFSSVDAWRREIGWLTEEMLIQTVGRLYMYMYTPCHRVICHGGLKKYIPLKNQCFIRGWFRDCCSIVHVFVYTMSLSYLPRCIRKNTCHWRISVLLDTTEMPHLDLWSCRQIMSGYYWRRG